MDQGKVVGVGTHEQLIHSCGVYKNLYEAQSHGMKMYKRVFVIYWLNYIFCKKEKVTPFWVFNPVGVFLRKAVCKYE